MGAADYWSERAVSGYAPNWYSFCSREISRRVTGDASAMLTHWAMKQAGKLPARRFLDELRKEAASALAALDARANELEGRLTDALARSFSLTLASGREVIVSERDALQLFAAVPICLRRDTARLELASGQTEDFKMTDLEQLADAIVAANFHQPNAPNGNGSGASAGGP